VGDLVDGNMLWIIVIVNDLDLSIRTIYLGPALLPGLVFPSGPHDRLTRAALVSARLQSRRRKGRISRGAVGRIEV
jgi:hypothetical protein